MPINLFEIIENWFDLSCTCIKWGAHVSNFFKLVFGVRQGGAMSPCLSAIFIDDIVTKLKSLGLGCNTILTCTSIFLYADDIMLISPSVSILQTMLHLCESELLDLDMSLIYSKNSNGPNIEPYETPHVISFLWSLYCLD